jgi:4-diphosphocytidyl-2-C-methyl-D-erythritol kinase
LIERRFLSPAKVNLRLEVLGKKEDGYHEISSIIQPIDLYDKITLKVEKGDGTIRVDCNHPEIPSGRGNLAFRAAEAVSQSVGLKGNLTIGIEKNIPVAGGLGGGSSDAATVLKGLNDMLGEKLSSDELLKIGITLGADVPFFLLGKNSLVTGIGEILEEIYLPKFWYVLINPSFPVSTREVYQNSILDLTKESVDISIKSSKKYLESPVFINKLLHNDLERVVVSKYPEVKRIKNILVDKGALGSLLSGSGSTVFGLFLEEDQARKAYEWLLKDVEENDWTIFLASGL